MFTVSQSISPSFTRTDIFETSGRKIASDLEMLETKDLADIVVWVVSTSSRVHVSYTNNENIIFSNESTLKKKNEYLIFIIRLF